MFVLKKTYDAMVQRAHIAESAFGQLNRKWNKLVRRINEKGGEDFLERGRIHPPASQFTQEEIIKLIHLCHPDKHGGKEMATVMTQKLLKMKK